MQLQNGWMEDAGWEGENNERVYERFGMGMAAKGVDCEDVEWVKHCMLRWIRCDENEGD